MRAGITLTALMLAGCGASEHSRFYVLTENPAVLARVTADPPITTVALGAVKLPAALDRPQMARRLNSDEISYSEYDRWAGPLDDGATSSYCRPRWPIGPQYVFDRRQSLIPGKPRARR